MQKNVFFMKRALDLARLGAGRAHPNPLVGAVLVKNGRVIGEGAHEYFGGPHAEVNAIRSATKRGACLPDRQGSATGSTLYVTLEPCDHFGKTSPCTELILKSKIKKVFVGVKDPNPLVHGRGLRRLRAAGVQVHEGVLKKEAVELNKDYHHWLKLGRPYVIVKVAQSLDGKIATESGDSRWVTGPKARAFAHGLRAACDAVLIGVNTALKDDPRLNVRFGHGAPAKRRGGPAAQPWKVILDSHLRTPERARIFAGPSGKRVILAVTKGVPPARLAKFRKKASVLVVPSQRGRVDLKALLERLAQIGIVKVLIEGGGEVIADAFSKKLVNEVYFLTAPKIIGGKASVGSVGGRGAASLKKAVKLKRVQTRQLGEDLLVHGEV